MNRLILIVLLFAGIMSPAMANLAERFQDVDPESQISLDHSPWAEILERYLISNHPSGVNLFDYGGVTNADRGKLVRYIESLEKVLPRQLNRDEQMAYWINFYNALTVKVILDAYPVSSIKKIRLPGSFGGPWKAKLVMVAGESLSLDDIEHEILRPIWKDARIHYAVNCASIGCPDLAPKPYSAEELEPMLEASAQAYINHPRGVKWENGRLLLSSIFDWYKQDFGNREELIAHLMSYAEGASKEALNQYSGRVRFHYDWDLNAP